MTLHSPSQQASLARGILLAMSCVALIPLVIMAAQGLHCARQAVVELELTHLDSTLAARTSQLAAWLEERGGDLQFASLVPCGQADCTGLAGHPAPEHIEALRRMGQERPLYESLALFDAAGQSLGGWTAGSHDPLGSLLDDELRGKLAAATGLVASVSHRHEDGRIGLHLGYPIRSAGDRTEAFLVVNVDPADALSVILGNHADPPKSARLYLLSADGRYLTDPVPDLGVVGRQASVPQSILYPENPAANSDSHSLLHAHNPTAIAYTDSSGVPVFGSSARVPALGWILVAEKPVADALAWQRILVRRALATGLATFLAVLWLATRFSRRLAEPLRRLADTARQIAAGSTRRRVGMLPGAEADEVGHAFNEMLDALARAQEKVVHSASLAAIGELSVSVVHEMRNPLASIKLNLQALRNKVADDPDYAELADIAGRQASRLERMLSELLQFGKPIELRPAAVTFADLAGSAIGILDPSARERGVTLRCRDETGNRALHVDREHLGRAVENLVRNAMEASPAGGTVWIEGCVTDGRAPMLEIRVRDGGGGIPERVLQHLFQPFVTTRDQGTGLGLANVKKVAELHDGSVHGANLPDGGALFVIAIPLQPGGHA